MRRRGFLRALGSLAAWALGTHRPGGETIPPRSEMIGPLDETDADQEEPRFGSVVEVDSGEAILPGELVGIDGDGRARVVCRSTGPAVGRAIDRTDAEARVRVRLL